MSQEYQGNTPEDVASRIAENIPGGLLAFDEDEGEAAPEATEDAPAKENSPPEQQQEEPPAEAEEEEEEKDTDEKPEEEEEPEKDESASEEDDPVFEVALADGETAEVPLSELAAGYLQSKDIDNIKAETDSVRRDYERRMQELPELARQQTERERQELIQSIQQWADLNAPPPAPPMSLLDPNSPDYNPEAYHYQKAQREAHEAQAREGMEKLRAIQQQREEQQKAIEAREREKLREAWPELLEDSAKRDAFLKSVEKHYGLDANDVASFNDHRAFLVLRDAVGYREMKAQAPNVRQKVQTKPKPVKAKTRNTKSESRKADVADQKKRLRKTGRPEDAMAILEHMDL